MKALVAAVLILAALIGFAGQSSPALPHCYEDQVLVGVGQFEHGYWTDYVCQNLD